MSRYANCHPRPPGPVGGMIRFISSVRVVGNSRLDGLLSELGNRALLASGFRHELRVAAFIESGNDRVISPMSAPVALDGDTQVCSDAGHAGLARPADGL